MHFRLHANQFHLPQSWKIPEEISRQSILPLTKGSIYRVKHSTFYFITLYDSVIHDVNTQGCMTCDIGIPVRYPSTPINVNDGVKHYLSHGLYITHRIILTS